MGVVWSAVLYGCCRLVVVTEAEQGENGSGLFPSRHFLLRTNRFWTEFRDYIARYEQTSEYHRNRKGGVGIWRLDLNVSEVFSTKLKSSVGYRVRFAFILIFLVECFKAWHRKCNFKRRILFHILSKVSHSSDVFFFGQHLIKWLRLPCVLNISVCTPQFCEMLFTWKPRLWQGLTQGI